MATSLVQDRGLSQCLVQWWSNCAFLFLSSAFFKYLHDHDNTERAPLISGPSENVYLGSEWKMWWWTIRRQSWRVRRQLIGGNPPQAPQPARPSPLQCATLPSSRGAFLWENNLSSGPGHDRGIWGSSHPAGNILLLTLSSPLFFIITKIFFFLVLLLTSFSLPRSGSRSHLVKEISPSSHENPLLHHFPKTPKTTREIKTNVWIKFSFWTIGLYINIQHLCNAVTIEQ